MSNANYVQLRCVLNENIIMILGKLFIVTMKRKRCKSKLNITIFVVLFDASENISM